MTPIPASIVRPLIKGLRYELVVRDDRAKKLFPDIQPLNYESAVNLALRRIEEGQIETIWSDALASSKGDMRPVYLAQEQGMLIERRHKIVNASSEIVYETFSALGGERGWPPFNWLWRARGAIDRLMGGVGMRRGRRHPIRLRDGEALDFWRVEQVKPGRLLRLRAEMKLPGRGWLQYETMSNQEGQTELAQTAYFAPKGLLGLIYWYGIYPLHGLIFAGTIEEIARRAEISARRAAQMLTVAAGQDEPTGSITVDNPLVDEGNQ